MPPVQTNYTQYMRVAVAGQIADMLPHTIETRTVQTAAGIPFGSVTVAGTADQQVDIPPATGVYVGVAVLNPASLALTPPTPDANRYGQFENASIMLKGTIWVTVGVNVTAEAAAGYDPTSGAWVLAGTAGATAIPNARWVSSAASGALAKLQLR